MDLFARLLAEGGNQSDLVTTVLPILRVVLFFIAVASAIILTICVIMQSNSQDNTLDVMSGKQESYYSQNKGSSRDGKLKIITIVMACVIFVCILVYLITQRFNG